MENFVENVENFDKKKLLGKHYLTLDDKGRINIPTSFRDALDDGFIIARHINIDPDKLRLEIYTKQSWEAFYDKLSVIQLEERNELILEIEPHEIEPKSGRFVVPASLRSYANLEGKLCISGIGDTAVLWKEEEKIEIPANTARASAMLRRYGI